MRSEARLCAALLAALLLSPVSQASWTLGKNPKRGVARNPAADTDSLPGRRADSYQPPKRHTRSHAPKMTVLDEKARIYEFTNFLTDDECDHIINLAAPRMQRSGVVDAETGVLKFDDEVRTSSGAFLERGEDSVIAEIEERIARWAMLPVENQEGLQVLRYGPTEHYSEHFDFFFDKDNVQNGGNRCITVLIYLNDVEEGGETVFPNIPAPGGDNGPEYSECARYHLAAKPRKGTALLFHSIRPNGELERRSLHTACPVIKGVKFSAPKWIHVGKFAVLGEQQEEFEIHHLSTGGQEVAGCEDRNDLCESWAASGECERNFDYMVGSRKDPGTCIRSCKRCDLVVSGAEAQARHYPGRAIVM